MLWPGADTRSRRRAAVAGIGARIEELEKPLEFMHWEASPEFSITLLVVPNGCLGFVIDSKLRAEVFPVVVLQL